MKPIRTRALENADEEALQACAGDPNSMIAEATQTAYRMQVKNMDLRAALREIFRLTTCHQSPICKAIREVAKNALQ